MEAAVKQAIDREVAYRRRHPRAARTDCLSCKGMGFIVMASDPYADVVCVICLATGMNTIPWAELFSGKRQP